jgi:succinate-acetate transporter protein
MDYSLTELEALFIDLGDTRTELCMSETKTATMTNPAVVGFGGFGITTIIQQLHDLGLCSIGPGIACGLILGGVVQFIVGFQELKCGNNFGFAVFTSFGAFWLIYCLIHLFDKLQIYQSSATDLAYFLVVWNVYTIILWLASMFINSAVFSTFTWLVLGFVLLNLAQFGFPAMSKVAAFVFIFGALNAWYITAHILFKGLFGRDVLPVGEPWLRPWPVRGSQG